MNMIWIDTTRYSKVVRAFLSHHPDAVVRMNKRVVDSNPDDWCTNRKLKPLRDFSLTSGGQVVLSFHDSPDELFAPEDQLDLVKELKAKKMFRFQVLRQKE